MLLVLKQTDEGRVWRHGAGLRVDGSAAEQLFSDGILAARDGQTECVLAEQCAVLATIHITSRLDECVHRQLAIGQVVATPSDRGQEGTRPHIVDHIGIDARLQEELDQCRVHLDSAVDGQQETGIAISVEHVRIGSNAEQIADHIDRAEAASDQKGRLLEQITLLDQRTGLDQKSD